MLKVAEQMDKEENQNENEKDGEGQEGEGEQEGDGELEENNSQEAIQEAPHDLYSSVSRAAGSQYTSKTIISSL